MSQEQVEIVRRMYEARDAGDAERALACFHPQVVLDARVRMDSRIVHGREEAARIIGEWVEAFDDWREEIHEIRDLGDQVFVAATQRGRAKGSGVEVESRYALLYAVEDGQITRMALFEGEAEALAAHAVRESAMSRENVNVVATLMQDFNERKPWWELVDEGIEWHSRPDEPDATVHHGREAVRDYIDGWDEMFPGYRIEPDGVPIELGERVVFPARLVGVARTTGLAMSEPYVFVCTVSEGRILLVREFGAEGDARKAVGLEE